MKRLPPDEAGARSGARPLPPAGAAPPPLHAEFRTSTEPREVLCRGEWAPVWWDVRDWRPFCGRCNASLSNRIRP